MDTVVNSTQKLIDKGTVRVVEERFGPVAGSSLHGAISRGATIAGVKGAAMVVLGRAGGRRVCSDDSVGEARSADGTCRGSEKVRVAGASWDAGMIAGAGRGREESLGHVGKPELQAGMWRD